MKHNTLDIKYTHLLILLSTLHILLILINIMPLWFIIVSLHIFSFDIKKIIIINIAFASVGNDMDKAIHEVNVWNMSIRLAAATYHVPKSSLHDRISGRVEIGALPGKQPVFPCHVERLLADKVKEAAEMGFGISRQQLKAKAARLAASMRLKTPFKHGIKGED